ncbi:MAG: hypothetical protein H6740_14585 [Alphaproteobacteria bacterium]|nr:hypothetical protein [Alphaproteobacteria bacterium]
MRVLIEGLPYSGRGTLAWGLVSALQFRRMPAEHQSGPLRPTGLGRWASEARREAPAATLPILGSVAQALLDAGAPPPGDIIEVQQGYLGDALLQAAAEERGWALSALGLAERAGPQFDLVILLRAPRQVLFERMRAERRPDAAAASILGDRARFRRADAALRAWGNRQGAVVLNTNQLEPRHAQARAMEVLLAAWSTRTGWLVGEDALPGGAPLEQPYLPAFSENELRQELH